MSSSLSALNVSEDEDVNENVIDCSFASSQLDQSLQGDLKEGNCGKLPV